MSLQPRIYLVGVFAIIAAMGTLPYGYRFSEIFLQAPTLKIILGILFAVCAGSANAILGTYSLLKLEKKIIYENLYLVLIGAVGAIPQGFICYFGYRETLPVQLNLVISAIVTLVNAAINCTALNNLKQSSQDLFSSRQDLSTNEITFRLTGAIIGLVVSMLGYLAAANGLVNVFRFYNLQNDKVSYLLSVLTWIPYMALFANATQTVAAKLGKLFINFGAVIKSIQTRDILLLVFIPASGSAFAQMMLDFLNPANPIPSIFKTAPIQALAFPFLMPLAFLASAAVNYFAIQEVMAMPKNKIFNNRTTK